MLADKVTYFINVTEHISAILLIFIIYPTVKHLGNLLQSVKSSRQDTLDAEDRGAESLLGTNPSVSKRTRSSDAQLLAEVCPVCR